ncbi:MAG: AmmeMemoRadiSam system protein B [Thermoanaerobaculia bacterium]
MGRRQPAVAGWFYERDSERLRAQVDACFAANPPVTQKRRVVGAVVPHAGLMYSGQIAAALYAIADLPRRLVILCPNHTGFGSGAAINLEGSWVTPLGEVPIDTELAKEIAEACGTVEDDSAAHAREHSLEVQLPLLQSILPEFSIVPLCLGIHRYQFCEEIGEALAMVVERHRENDPVAIIASSDLNHHEEQSVTLRKDQLAIDRLLARDPRGLWETVQRERISMCGIVPGTAMLVAANQLGASESELIRHATSGDVNGDFDSVVGYAAVLVS